MTAWIKPDSTKIELNDLPATVEAAEALGWSKDVVLKAKPVKAVSKAKAKKAPVIEDK